MKSFLKIFFLFSRLEKPAKTIPEKKKDRSPAALATKYNKAIIKKYLSGQYMPTLRLKKPASPGEIIKLRMQVNYIRNVKHWVPKTKEMERTCLRNAVRLAKREYHRYCIELESE